MSKARDLADIASDDVIATTASGIDVTGTVTTDGLTVESAAPTLILKDNDSTGAPASGLIKFNESDNSTSAQVGFGSTSNSDFDIFQAENAAIDVWTNATQRMSIEGNGDISFYEDTGTTPKFFWDASAESLGIGTSSLSATIDVYNPQASGVSDIAKLRYNNAGSGGALAFANQAGTSLGKISNVANGANVDLAFSAYNSGTALTEFMRIGGSGFVGIGTSSPAGMLQISSTFPTLILDETNTDAAYQQTQLALEDGSFRIKTRTSTNTFVSNDYVMDKNSSGATNHSWRIGNTERMRIASSGNVGIGTSSPGYPLHVIGAASVTGRTFLGSTLSAATPDYSFVSDSSMGMFRLPGVLGFSTGGTERMRIDSSGRLLVAATTIPPAAGSGPQTRMRLATSSFGAIVVGGTGAVDTGVPINQNGGGGTMLLLASRHTDAGTSTASQTTHIQFYYSGDNAPGIQVIGGSSFVAFGTTGSAGSKTLTVRNTAGGQANFSWFLNK